MISTSAIIFSLCIVNTKILTTDSSWQMDWHTGILYHVTPGQNSDTQPILPQDQDDAQAIVDSKMKEEVIAGIMAYREPSRRCSINAAIKDKNTGTPYIEESYKPQEPCNSLFKDLIYVLIVDASEVQARYLGNFMDLKDETWIIMAMVLTEDIESMTVAFDNRNNEILKIKRHKQRKPFQYLFKACCEQNREPPNGDPDKTSVTNDAKALKAEQDNGCWVENRDQIELITMKKSTKYGQAVIQEYEKLNGHSLDSEILGCVNTHSLNHDLADAYVSLVLYLKNKYKYISTILHQYSDDANRWAAWLMCINVLCSDEWPNINNIFKADYKESLAQFIVKKASSNPIFAETIAVVVDPSFKPTKFTKKPTKDDPGNSCPPPSG